VDYSAESAGAITSTFATTQERLRLGLLGVERAIDLKAAVPKLNRRTKRQLAWFIVNGSKPGTVLTKNGSERFPDPQAIAVKLAELDAHEDAKLIAHLKREMREVRACRTIATHMSGRRQRAPIQTRADRRLRGKPCVRCSRPIQLGQAVFHDSDWGSCWHAAGGCHD